MSICIHQFMRFIRSSPKVSSHTCKRTPQTFYLRLVCRNPWPCIVVGLFWIDGANWTDHHNSHPLCVITFIVISSLQSNIKRRLLDVSHAEDNHANLLVPVNVLIIFIGRLVGDRRIIIIIDFSAIQIVFVLKEESGHRYFYSLSTISSENGSFDYVFFSCNQSKLCCGNYNRVVSNSSSSCTQFPPYHSL